MLASSDRPSWLAGFVGGSFGRQETDGVRASDAPCISNPRRVVHAHAAGTVGSPGVRSASAKFIRVPTTKKFSSLRTLRG